MGNVEPSAWDCAAGGLLVGGGFMHLRERHEENKCCYTSARVCVCVCVCDELFDLHG